MCNGQEREKKEHDLGKISQADLRIGFAPTREFVADVLLTTRVKQSVSECVGDWVDKYVKYMVMRGGGGT